MDRALYLFVACLTIWIPCSNSAETDTEGKACSKVYNYNITSRDLLLFNDLSMGDCCETCIQVPNCTAWVWRPETDSGGQGYCHLKEEEYTKSIVFLGADSSAGYVVGYSGDINKLLRRENQSPQGLCEYHQEVEIFAYDKFTAFNQPKDRCCAICDYMNYGQAPCVGFTWSIDPSTPQYDLGNCHLKSKVAPFTKAQGKYVGLLISNGTTAAPNGTTITPNISQQAYNDEPIKPEEIAQGAQAEKPSGAKSSSSIGNAAGSLKQQAFAVLLQVISCVIAGNMAANHLQRKSTP